MEQKTNAVDTDAAYTAEAEKKENATSDRSTIGKFTSVDALYRAYERLEAEFTRQSKAESVGSGDFRRLRQNNARRRFVRWRKGGKSDNGGMRRRRYGRGESKFADGDGKQTRRGLSARDGRSRRGDTAAVFARKLLQRQRGYRAADATADSRRGGRTRETVYQI